MGSPDGTRTASSLVRRSRIGMTSTESECALHTPAEAASATTVASKQSEACHEPPLHCEQKEKEALTALARVDSPRGLELVRRQVRVPHRPRGCGISDNHRARPKRSVHRSCSPLVNGDKMGPKRRPADPRTETARVSPATVRINMTSSESNRQTDGTRHKRRERRERLLAPTAHSAHFRENLSRVNRLTRVN
jgi:hypothetical protein